MEYGQDGRILQGVVPLLGRSMLWRGNHSEHSNGRAFNP